MSFEEKKLLAINIVAIFSDRMKWGVFSKSIKNVAFPTALNYSKLLEKIENLTDSIKGNSTVDAICNLDGLLKEHVISGEKAIQLALVAPEYRDRFDSYVTAILANQNSQDDSWLFEREPSLRMEETPQLIHTMALDQGIVWGFNSTRETTSKEEIPATAISEEFRENLSENEKFFVIKKIIRRCHDVIFYDPTTGIVEFRIDNPLGFSTNERSRAFHMLDVAFKSFCMTNLSYQIKLDVYELFNAITALYEIPAGDGRVVELSFTTDEGGIKNSKKRHNDGCILEEEFHKGGCAGINNQLTPYKIARVWPFRSSNLNSDPELMLPGSLKMVSQSGVSNLILDEFLVTKSVGYSDYKMVTDKLRAILRIEQSDDEQAVSA